MLGYGAPALCCRWEEGALYERNLDRDVTLVALPTTVPELLLACLLGRSSSEICDLLSGGNKSTHLRKHAGLCLRCC